MRIAVRSQYKVGAVSMGTAILKPSQAPNKVIQVTVQNAQTTVR